MYNFSLSSKRRRAGAATSSSAQLAGQSKRSA